MIGGDSSDPPAPHASPPFFLCPHPHLPNAIRDRWCRRFINKVAMTGDLRSTQRSECINSVLADRVKKNSSIVNVSDDRSDIIPLIFRMCLSSGPGTTGPFTSIHRAVHLLLSQLFESLNAYADECRRKCDRRGVGSISTSTTTNTALEECTRQLRLPPFTFNKLVKELDRSRTYKYLELDVRDLGGETRVRRFQVCTGDPPPPPPPPPVAPSPTPLLWFHLFSPYSSTFSL